MERWQGRVVVVTGASGGIGEAVAKKLVTCGMKVAAIARRQHKLIEFESSVNVSGAKGLLKGYACDLTSKSDVAATFRNIEKDLGPVSVLVNNAVVFSLSTFTDLDLDVAKKLFETNVFGSLYCLKAAMESMKSNNITDGNIINMTCSLEDMRETEWAMYISSKLVMNTIGYSMNKQMSNEHSKIRVTSLMPGLVITPKTIDYIRAQNFVHYLQPEEVADAVVYVISVPQHIKVTELKIFSYVNEINS